MRKLYKRLLAAVLALVLCTGAVSSTDLFQFSQAEEVHAAKWFFGGLKGTAEQHKNSFGGKSTMEELIRDDYEYTDNMTLMDYMDGRSASHDRNYTSTGKHSDDYLLQAVEWTNMDKGEALLTVTGRDTTDSVALYVFSTCLANGGFTGNTVRDNLIDLLQFYDRVDAICIDNGWAWALLSDRHAIGGDSCGTYNNVFTKNGTGRVDDGNNTVWHTVGKAKGSQTKTYAGIQPYVSFYAEDYNDFSYTNSQVSKDVTNFLNAFEWVGGRHDMDMYLAAIKGYICGDLSFKEFNCANSYNLQLHPSTMGVDGATVSPQYYQSVLYSTLLKDFERDDVKNIPQAVYIECSDYGQPASSDVDVLQVGNDKAFAEYLVDQFCNEEEDEMRWFTLISKGVSTFSQRGTKVASRRQVESSATRKESALRCAVTALNPRYALEHWDEWPKKTMPYSAPAAAFGVNNAEYRYDYATPFKTGGIRMPDKKLTFEIPIGDMWRLDLANLPDCNIVYTYKQAETSSHPGEYITKSGDGQTLDPKVSVDKNNVVRITTNCYVKGAELSIQIPLRYSTDGMQSARELYQTPSGKVSIDPNDGELIPDTYVLAMTSADTKLYVGRDVLGDLDTSLSIFMPAKDLLDIKVNLHWMNDSARIKGLLNDKSVRNNAVALIGGDALVGDTVGALSDRDEKAGGHGSSVVAMTYADANGNIAAPAKSYNDPEGNAKVLANDNVILEVQTRNGKPDLWTVEEDNADNKNVVSYVLRNMPRYGYATEYTYDAEGKVTSYKDLTTDRVPKYYFVEDIVDVPAGYTGYNIDEFATENVKKLQKTTGSDSENPTTYQKPLYYAYVVTPPEDWSVLTKATYTIDCYVSLDIKSLLARVEHHKEQLKGDGYKPVEDKEYVLEEFEETYVPLSFVFAPEVKEYFGYDSPEPQELIVTPAGEAVIKYYYDIHYYKITVDTDGGDWVRQDEDGNWVPVPEPPTGYTAFTPDITLSRPDKTGFSFTGYDGTDLTETTKDVVIKEGSLGDREYKAVWEALPFDVEVPVSLIYSMGWDGTMIGAFDQSGDGTITEDGFLKNNSAFPVQVVNVQYNNKSPFVISAEKDENPSVKNIMNWRLDATRGNYIKDIWASDLVDGVDTSTDLTYRLEVDDTIGLTSDTAWMLHDEYDIKDLTKIGDIIWTFGIGARTVN